MKINTVRKNKGVHSPHRVLGECGAKPTNCGRSELEVSSMSWKTKDNEKNH